LATIAAAAAKKKTGKYSSGVPGASHPLYGSSRFASHGRTTSIATQVKNLRGALNQIWRSTGGTAVSPICNKSMIYQQRTGCQQEMSRPPRSHYTCLELV
jgi:hypothetical protein